jgi:hypothetical protein
MVWFPPVMVCSQWGGKAAVSYFKTPFFREASMIQKREEWAEHYSALERFKAEITALAKKDLEDAGAGAASTSKIWHYTDVAGGMAIIESGKLWFTERAHLSDTLELRHGLRIARQMFDASVRQVRPNVPQSATDHLMEEIETGLVEYGYWIVRFSYKNDDWPQWRNYADEGRGVCLGFSVDDLDMFQFASRFEEPISKHLNCLRFPVKYDETELRRSVKPYIDLGVNLLGSVGCHGKPSYSYPDGIARRYERDLLQHMMSGLYLNSMMYKHEAFKHEEEYRFGISACRPKVEPSFLHRVRARGGEIVSYLDLPIPNWPTALADIRIGPAAVPRLEEQLSTVFRSHGITLMPKMERSKLPSSNTRANVL